MVLYRWLLFIWLFTFIYTAISFCRSRVSNNFTNTLNSYDTNKRIYVCTTCMYIQYITLYTWLKINCSLRCCLTSVVSNLFSFFWMENMKRSPVLYTSHVVCVKLYSVHASYAHTDACYFRRLHSYCVKRTNTRTQWQTPEEIYLLFFSHMYT